MRQSTGGAAILVMLVTSLGCNEGEVPIGEAGSAIAVGEWEGYIENVHFASGSDAIRMNITGGQADHIEGTVSFGSGAPPSPPTDPDVGYPEGLECGFSGVNDNLPFEGFEHTVISGTMSSARLQFALELREVWRAWCELQTPIADAVNDGRYMCLPNANSGMLEDGTCHVAETPVDCCKLQLCHSGSSGCQCTVSGCTVPLVEEGVHFDLKIDGDNADGTVVGLGEVGLVRLIRQP